MGKVVIREDTKNGILDGGQNRLICPCYEACHWVKKLVVGNADRKN